MSWNACPRNWRRWPQNRSSNRALVSWPRKPAARRPKEIREMIPNLIGSEWRRPPDGVESLPVYNPATGEVIEQVPMSGASEVDAAVRAAVAAYRGWSGTALMERVRLMFRYKALLEEHFEDLAS